jgi:5'-3' exonuclease
MRVHLIDGTYELFRQHFGQVARHSDAGPYAAAVGVVASTLQLVSDGATHLGVASDHVIESFRNEMWPGYKTSAGMAPELLSQIPVMEEALVSAGFTTWAMVEHEADDALGAAAAVAGDDPRVTQVMIITPDKDLGQCVRGTRIVQYDRRKGEIIDEDAVRLKFGVGPITWRSSATPRMATPASPDGVPRARRPCWPSSARSPTSRRRRVTGGCPRCVALRSWP